MASSVSVRPTSIRPSPTACATFLLPEKTCAPLAFNARKYRFAASSPHAANRQAAWVAVVPNRGLARPILFFRRGSIRSSNPRGRSDSLTVSTLINKTLARAARPYQVLSAALNAGAIPGAAATSKGCKRPWSCNRMVLRISLFQNRSQRGRAFSATIALTRPTVLVLSTSYFAATSTPVLRA